MKLQKALGANCDNTAFFTRYSNNYYLDVGKDLISYHGHHLDFGVPCYEQWRLADDFIVSHSWRFWLHRENTNESPS
jgi:hypothetical protein